MRIAVLGGDGYLGWPTAMHLAAAGHDVIVVDNYLRRTLASRTGSEALFTTPDLHQRAQLFRSRTNHHVEVRIGDLTDFGFTESLIRDERPDAVVHYAEQPAAPYSMIGFEEARLTLNNNINTTFNLIWSVIKHAPDCHIVKLGTMGEYGTPNIDIEEGWIDVEHNGRKETFLYPRQGGSLYHTTKIIDTDLLWFYVRTAGLTVTDLMQGPVYGIDTEQTEIDRRLRPHFHYDDIFGTVLNRFLVQAVAGIPLTVYGQGGQTRGYLNIRDTMQCIELAITHPAKKGELRIFNQFVEQFSVQDLAHKVQQAGNEIGLAVEISPLENPRKEKESHYYNAKHTKLLDLGLIPHLLDRATLVEMLREISLYRDLIDPRKIFPRVRWA